MAVKRRQRMTKAEIEQLEKQALEILEESRPASVRHVFYRLTNPRLEVPIPKTEQGYSRVVHRVGVMRKEGRLPYSWISDSSRTGWHTNSWDDMGDFVEHAARLYRKDLWRTHGLAHVEVWCESRSAAGMIQGVCRDLRVSLYPTGGFSSLTLCYEAAVNIDHRVRETGLGDVAILILTDFDPAGFFIDEDYRAKLGGHLAELSTPATLHVERLAITPEQITELDLPTKPRKSTEKRKQEIEATVEIEAMPVNILRSELRRTVESYLEPRALEIVKSIENSERIDLLELARSRFINPD